MRFVLFSFLCFARSNDGQHLAFSVRVDEVVIFHTLLLCNLKPLRFCFSTNPLLKPAFSKIVTLFSWIGYVFSAAEFPTWCPKQKVTWVHIHLRSLLSCYFLQLGTLIKKKQCYDVVVLNIWVILCFALKLTRAGQGASKCLISTRLLKLMQWYLKYALKTIIVFSPFGGCYYLSIIQNNWTLLSFQIYFLVRLCDHKNTSTGLDKR